MASDETTERLSDALDRVNGAAAGSDASNELIGVARFLQRLDQRDQEPEPDPIFLQRLEQKLMSVAASAGPDQPEIAQIPTAMASGQARPPVNSSRLWVPSGSARRRSRPHWGGTPYLAAAAVLLLTLLAGFATYRLVPTSGAGAGQTPSLPARGMALSATPTAIPTSDTGMYGGNAARTWEMPGPGPEGQPQIAWKQPLGSNYRAPIVAGGKAFVIIPPDGRNAFQLAAFDANKGTPLWRVPIEGTKYQSLTSPAVAGKLVYVTTSKLLVAYQTEDGKVAWQYAFTATDATSTDPPAVADGLVFVTASDYTVRAIDAATGDERWRVTVPGAPSNLKNVPEYHPWVALAMANGIVYVENGRGLVSALDALDGHQLWTYDTGADIVMTSLVADGTLVVTGKEGSHSGDLREVDLYTLNAKTGNPMWGPLAFDGSFNIAAGDAAVYVAPSSTKDHSPVNAYDLRTGKRRWTFETNGGPGSLVYVDGELYVDSHDGTIRRINTKTGKADWSVYLNAGEIAVADGKIFTIMRGSLVAVSGDGGTVSAAAAPVDLSGVAACVPPRPAPTAEITGKPSATLQAETKLLPRQGGTSIDGQSSPFINWPQILIKNLPTGNAANPGVTKAILQTLRTVNPCAVRPEATRQIAGFFTDDFFRRGIVPFDQGGYTITWAIQPDEKELAGMRTVVLPDGRVAAIVPTPVGQGGTLFIFKQVNGHWLIDELYRMGTKYNSGEMG